MAHNITAIVLKGKYSKQIASEYDLEAILLNNDLSLFHISDSYATYWQWKLNIKGNLNISVPSYMFSFPTQIVIAKIVQSISLESQPHFAIIQTDYFGSYGYQFANAFVGENNVNMDMKTINEALRFLGVNVDSELDEFDTIGLANIRYPSDEFIEKYKSLCDKYDL